MRLSTSIGRTKNNVILTTVREEESLTKRASCHSERSGEKNLTFSETLTEQCHSEVRSTEESPVKRIFLMIFLADASE